MEVRCSRGSLTDGSSITVQYRQGEIVNDDAFVPNTGELTEEGKYLLVPVGMEQSIAHSGEGKAYGYLLLAGSKPDLVPGLVDRVDEQTIRADAVADGYTYSFEKDGDEWLIANPFEQYLYMKGTYASFNYIDDLGDLEDEQWPNCPQFYLIRFHRLCPPLCNVQNNGFPYRYTGWLPPSDTSKISHWYFC